MDLYWSLLVAIRNHNKQPATSPVSAEVGRAWSRAAGQAVWTLQSTTRSRYLRRASASSPPRALRSHCVSISCEARRGEGGRGEAVSAASTEHVQLAPPLRPKAWTPAERPNYGKSSEPPSELWCGAFSFVIITLHYIFALQYTEYINTSPHAMRHF